MFIVGMVTWWYGAGWRRQFHGLGNRLSGVVDYFSIDLLARTFFSPFRQISAGRVSGPLGVKIRAFFDRLVSRLIGAMVRLVMISIGIMTIIMYALVGGVVTLGWAVIPALPLLGIMLFLSGWTPWN